MTAVCFEPCKLKYSLVQGVFVVSYDGEFAAICDSHKVLLEWLDGRSYKDIGKITIHLSAVNDWDKDEVTHVVFEDRRGDYETYEAWSAWHGEDAFMEYWFDESSSRQYDEDFARRYRDWKAINEPVCSIAPVPEAATSINLIAAE